MLANANSSEKFLQTKDDTENNVIESRDESSNASDVNSFTSSTGASEKQHKILTTKLKKRTRASKREIPVYIWSDKAARKLARFVKSTPQLFDKREKDWQNISAKSQLWAAAGKMQDPPATGPQCKKLYENMRTRVGKIMKKEKEIGTGHSDRTARDKEIMNTWSFLCQHIIQSKTNADMVSADTLYCHFHYSDSRASAEKISRGRPTEKTRPKNSTIKLPSTY